MYTMVMQVLTDFQLEIIIIGEAIVKMVIFYQIWPICGTFVVQIVYKIAKFELISEFSNLYHGNTNTDRVSSQNDNHW